MMKAAAMLLVTLSFAAAGAATASDRITDVDYLKANRCRGLAEGLGVGDTASFVDRHQQPRVGKIVRLNLKTATLECDNGEWRVSYGLLQHLVDL